MLKRAGVLALLLIAAHLPAQQPGAEQPRLFVRSAGPGEPGRILSAAVSAPHVLIRPALG
jgi:hypothetical protein